MLSLSQRRLQPEVMDKPDLDESRHLEALRGLERINRWSGSARILWPPIADLARRTPDKPLRILDIATGAGDVPISLWHKAQRAGLPIEVAGCDVRTRAVLFAQERAREQRADVRFFELDVLAGPLPNDYDVLTSSLFLHHLTEEEAAHFLRRAGSAARRMVLINDLVRGMPGFLLAYVGTRLLSRSPIVHVDGPRSVANAFTMDEALALARRAELHAATVARRWPCRFLLSWRR
jgi:2-polyprenyl-3-methyl-5-hydroxy-6-metoxy-1,4-benzoquinol methylase